MLIELVLKQKKPELDFEGYEKVKVGSGMIFANPVDKRIELMIKNHADGRVSVFTDKSDVVKIIEKTFDIVDVHLA